MSEILGELKTATMKSGESERRVSQEFKDGSRMSLSVRKISNGFIVKKTTYKPHNKKNPTDKDYENQHKEAEFYTKTDPGKKEDGEKESLFEEFILERGKTKII